MTPVPFYIAPGRVPGQHRRFLLLSYHFPPRASAGALRWQKMLALAAERGWLADVITIHPSSFASADPSRLEELPAGTRAFGTRLTSSPMTCIEDRALATSRWLRQLGGGSRDLPAHDGSKDSRSAPPAAGGPGSLPPEEIRFSWTETRSLLRAYHVLRQLAEERRWVRAMHALGASLLRRSSHDLVISSGPPHLVHVAARALAGTVSVPHIVDLRDPWSLRRRLPEPTASPLWFRIADREERRVVESAALIVANSDSVERAMIDRYPWAASRIRTVMNGFDDEDVPCLPRPKRFTVVYAGNIYLDRDPSTLFRGLARVVRNLGLTPADIGVAFIGNAAAYGGVPLAALARAAGIAEYIEVLGVMSRQELKGHLAKAAMLVSLPQDSRYAIPSKVFEYMGFDAWLLAMAEAESPVERLLRGTAADVVDPSDESALGSIIERRYLEYRSGIHPQRLSRETRFSRRHQAQVLLDAIEQVIPARADSGPAEVASR